MIRRHGAGNYAVFALGILTLATTLFAVWRHFSPLPFGDSWDGTIGFYMRAMHDPWHAFFEQHNEHRLVFSRLIFFADVRYFDGRNVLSLISNLVLAGLLATAFYRITLHHLPELSREVRFGVAGATLVFVFSWIQNENFTWGFQSQWFAVYLFALLTFHSIERTAEAQASNERTKSLRWLAASLLAACAAAGSMSSGVLVFPVLIVQAIYLRLRLLAIGVIALLTAAVWFAYFASWHAPASSGNLANGLTGHPVGAIRYALLYLGAPALHAGLGLRGAYVCGLLVVSALAAGCVSALRHRVKYPQGIALLAFAIFVAGNALLTAGGRLWFGLESALASRYTTASLASWLALIIFAAINSGSARQLKRVMFVGVCSTLLIASYQRTAFRSDHDVAYSRLVAGLALRDHVYDPAVTRAVYPFPDALITIAKAAETAQLSVFAPDQPDYLLPPDHVSATEACDGYIGDLSATTTPGVYRATGWIYNPVSKQTARAVVITDSSGTTLGTGVTGGERDDLRKIYGRHAQYSGWTAFFKAPATDSIRVNGQMSASTYCTFQAEKAGAVTPAATTQ